MNTLIISKYAISKKNLDAGLKVAEIALYAIHSEAYEEALEAHDASSWDDVEAICGPIDALYDENPWIILTLDEMEGGENGNDVLLRAIAASLAGAKDKDALHMAALLAKSEVCRDLYFETVSKAKEGQEEISVEELAEKAKIKFFKDADLDDVKQLVSHLLRVMEELGFLQCSDEGLVKASNRLVTCPVSAAILVMALDYALRSYWSTNGPKVKVAFPVTAEDMNAVRRYVEESLWYWLEIQEEKVAGDSVE